MKSTPESRALGSLFNGAEPQLEAIRVKLAMIGRIPGDLAEIAAEIADEDGHDPRARGNISKIWTSLFKFNAPNKIGLPELFHLQKTLEYFQQNLAGYMDDLLSDVQLLFSKLREVSKKNIAELSFREYFREEFMEMIATRINIPENIKNMWVDRVNEMTGGGNVAAAGKRQKVQACSVCENEAIGVCEDCAKTFCDGYCFHNHTCRHT